MDYEEFQRLKKKAAKIPPPETDPPEDMGYIKEFLDQIEDTKNGN